MPARRLLVRKIREVLRLKHKRGLSHRAIAQACAIGLGTVSLYLQRTAQQGLGWPLPAELDDAALEARLFRRAAPAHDRVRPDCAYIHRELKRDGVTLQLLWEEYAQVHPNGFRRTQFCEIYRQWARRLRPSMRQVHRAGEKTFIDFSGKRPVLVDPRTGEVRRVELFVAVLGASSFTYAEATATQQLADWVDAHTRMVEYFGGTTALWVPDQLKSAITRPCRYEPGVNRTYEDLAAHYGAVVVPARPRKPRDKAAVEGAVLLAQRWILARLRDQTFFSLGALNAAIRVLLDELNDRPLKKLGISRRALYEQIDRPALQPLPATRYVLAQWKLCRLNIDYHVEVERHVYSVPYQLVREQARSATRPRPSRSSSTARVVTPAPLRRTAVHRGRAHAERPPRPRRWTPSRLIRWAETVGPATGPCGSCRAARTPSRGIAPAGNHAAGRQRPARRRERPRGGSWRPHLKNILATGPGPWPTSAAPTTTPRPPRRTADRTLQAERHEARRDGRRLAAADPDRRGHRARLRGALACLSTPWTAREQRKLQRRSAPSGHPRGRRLHPSTPAQPAGPLGTCAWVAERHNLILIGPTGIGKRTGLSPRLHRRTSVAARARGRPRRRDAPDSPREARPARLVDDRSGDAERRDLTEVEDRAERASTLIAVTRLARRLGDANQADAICDRLLHDAHRIERRVARCDGRTRPRPGRDDMSIPTPAGLWIAPAAWKTRTRRTAECTAVEGVSHTALDGTKRRPPLHRQDRCTSVTGRLHPLRNRWEETTDQRRCAPTSVHVRRNPCSRSPDPAFNFTGMRSDRASLVQ